MKVLVLASLLLSHFCVSAFAPRFSQTRISAGVERFAEVSDLTETEREVYDFVEDLHSSEFNFRVVVVGNGAILESTHPLGPTMKLNASPKTGEHLITFASEDQSFEFHLKCSQVKSIALAERPGPDGEVALRIFRFMNLENGPLCSLILGDKSDEAASWFDGMKEKHGGQLEF